MGIEPTDRAVNARPSSFEDCGRHQAYKHFQVNISRGMGKYRFLLSQPLLTSLATPRLVAVKAETCAA